MAKKQGTLAGMEREEIPELTEAAEAFRKERDKFAKQQKKMTEARDLLIEMAAKHKIKPAKPYAYEDSDGRLRSVTVVDAKTKVTIKLIKTEDAGAGGEDDEKSDD